jgi:tetratricopeptide (TPR) repeat protein
VTNRYRIFSLGLALAFASAPVRAQEEEAAAQPVVKREHPDLSFARALGYSYSWYDLAFDVLEQLEKARPGAEIVDQAQLLRAELKTSFATSQRDPAKKDEVLKEVRKFYEELIAKKPGTPAANDAQLRIGEMLLQEGDAAFARMRTSEDSDGRATARKEAEEKFGQAEKYFEDLKEKFKKGIEQAEKANDATKVSEAHYKHSNAWFNLARSAYQKAQLFDRGAKEREERLAKCAEHFEAINFEYGDQFLGYEAAIFLGLVYKDLGNLKKAYEAFDSALGIKDFLPTSEKGEFLNEGPGPDLVARAAYFKAQTANELKDYESALAAVKTLYQDFPNMQRDRLGYAARVEEGKALAGKGDSRKAQAVLEKIIEDDKGGPWAASAREALGLLSGAGGPGVVVAPDRQLATAETLIDRGRAVEGLNQMRMLVASLEQASPEEQAKWLPLAWLKLGQAYAGLKRLDEAAACFDALVQRFKTDVGAPKALFQAAMARSQLNGAKTNDFDKTAYLDTLKKLQSDYPNDPAAKATGFFLGIERFSARDFAKAAEEFEKTDEKAGEIYDAALYQAGLAHFLNGFQQAKDKKEADAKQSFARARLALEKAIEWSSGKAFASNVPEQGPRADTLKKISFDARCRLAELALHPVARDVKRALEAAANAEKAAGEDKLKVAQARLLKVQAHLAGEEIDKAEEVAASMVSEVPDSKQTAQAEREVAIATDNLGKAASKAGKAEEAKGFFGKAADHYTRWLEIAATAGLEIPARDLSIAADRVFSLALMINALPETSDSESFTSVDDLSKLPDASRFATAAKAYEGAIAGGAADPALLRLKAGECYGFTRQFDKAAKSLADACNEEKLLIQEKAEDEKGKTVNVVNINVNVASKRPIFLFAYADYARCLFELSSKDRKLLDECIAALGRVISVAPAGEPIWWRGKYYLFAALYEKGEYDSAAIGLKQLQRQNPQFDGGKYNLKPKFEALVAKLEAKKSGPKPATGGGKK